MTQAITQTWLRRQHKKSASKESFRKWCRGEGKTLVEAIVAGNIPWTNEYPDGPNYNVHKLTGVPMGEGSEVEHIKMLEAQKARKTLAGILMRASRNTRRGRKGKLKKK